MKLLPSFYVLVASCVAAGALALPNHALAADTMAQAPVLKARNPPPLVLLTMGRDEKLAYPAYNDYTDIDGDGNMDIGYKPAIRYYGYFDSNICYTYSATDSRFSPTSATTTKTCSGTWSGDFLNYLTMSRLDIVRRVFYGGRRIVDDGTTVLERAFIPQDAHVWGREYDAAIAGYLISDYTPYAQPQAGRRHFFANVSRTADQSRPLLRVLLDRRERIWNWVAKEGPVAEDIMTSQQDPIDHSGYDLTVRVVVCVLPATSGFAVEGECKGYPVANPTVYKPTGILHEYGENRTIAFGLLTGSYEKQRSGGVLRRNVGYFDAEINPANGRFLTTIDGIARTIDKFRIAQFTGSYPDGCAAGNCKDYGSPIAEMMYEGLRYFGGATTPTSAYTFTSSTVESALGLTTETWTNPYGTSGGFDYCSKPIQMVVSDVYPSYDTDELPGSYWPASSFSTPSTPASVFGLNVQTETQTVSSAEAISGRYFIGDSASNSPNTDRSPTLKTVTSLATIRGLAPAEPSRQGGYYASGVARFGKKNAITSPSVSQKVTTYAIALSAAFPKLSFPVGTGKISLIPFAQSVGGCSYGDFDPNSTARNPMTNRLAGLYIDYINNVPGINATIDLTKNGGRPEGAFRVSYEDNTEGTDNDMDGIAVYTFRVNSTGTVTITITSEYNAGCILQHMGFVIAGTTADGAFLGVRDVDAGKPCNTTAVLNDATNSFNPGKCVGGLGYFYSRDFTVSTAGAADANIPRDPLFYAAKYGGPGINDDASKGPVVPVAVETAINGVPAVKGYYLVTDPQKLRAQLTDAFNEISKNAQPTVAAVSTSAFARPDGGLFLPGYVNDVLGAADALSTDVPANFINVNRPTVWEGTLSAQKFVGSGSAVALAADWTVTNASFGTSNSTASTTTRNIYTQLTSGATPTYGLIDPSSWLSADFATSATANFGKTLDSTTTTGLVPNSVITARIGSGATANEKKREIARVVALYLLGDRTYEERRGGSLRTRRALLGDIVNSTPAYQGQLDEGWATYKATISEGATYAAYVAGKPALKTVYVGANAGMLHAFNAGAGSGAERWAFIPKAVQTNLSLLAAPGYQHRYFIDGQLTVADAYIGSAWKTVLIGALGAGGKSVFALDVTNPTTPTVLWELTHEDLGYALGRPQVVRLADGKWVAIFSNGYESARTSILTADQTVARLFIVDLANGAVLGTAANLTVPSQGVKNGLGSPAIKTVGGIAKTVWAGDLAGNLWRFALGTSAAASALSPSASPTPLFKAVLSVTNQPITDEPSLVPFPEGGDLLVFGTGKLFEQTDVSDLAVQSVYAVRDRGTLWTNLRRSDLANITVSSSGNYRFTAGAGAWWDAGLNTKRGWRLDLPLAGERVVTSPVTAFGTTVVSTAVIDNTDACNIVSDGVLMGVDVFTGGNPLTPIFDLNSDGAFGTGSNASADYVSVAGVATAPAGVRLSDPVSLVAINTGGLIAGFDATGAKKVQLKGTTVSGRRSWRQIQ